MTTGLFLGSFNPIHNGHLQIARYILETQLCDEIWFVISPQNPLKQDKALLDEKKRLEVVEKALSSDPNLQACTVEFDMPKPSYTSDTLQKLSSLYPEKTFALIIGGDNLQYFHLWRNYRTILADYPIFVYPRPGIDTASISYPNVRKINAPLSDISSTEIRHKIQNGADITTFVPASALPLILRYYKTEGTSIR